MTAMKSRKDKDVSPKDQLPDAPVMMTLAPRYEPEKHGTYLSALEAAVSSTDNLNIALSGSYGVGKSSVLQEFSRLHASEVVEVSFSGLRADLKALVPVPGQELNPAATTKNNQIQKEIVKQLLYRERPANTPASKYRRPEVFQWKREFAVASLAGVSLAAVGYFTGLLDRPLSAFFNGRLQTALFLVALAAIVVIVLFGLRYFFHNRVVIEKFSAGPATIALSPQSATFFDEYLDEIVYFFQASSRRLVVFEDLDRFDDYEIFQSLRALNTLLNRSDQLKNKPVVFIYAVRDSIFQPVNELSLDAAEAELELANRTKFFDLVVPMVPFVSNRNARDLMIEEVNRRAFDISPELIDLAAQHVADMRLILNVMNEYALFDSVLVPGKTRAPSLTADKLFALVLYKNVHLKDFELVRLGRSDLDALYDRYREFSYAASSGALKRAAELQASRVVANRMSDRASRYGKALRAHLELVAEGLGLPSTYPNQISVNGTVVSTTDLSLPKTWRAISDDEVGVDAVLAFGHTNQTFGLSFDALTKVTGSDLDASEWRAVDDDELAEEHANALRRARDVAHMDMKALSGTTDRLAYAPDLTETFAEAIDRIIKSRLARTLIREGYIDEYFALFAAQYHESRVSENAMNFIIRRVDRGLADTYYPLSEDDVRSIIRERPEVLTDGAVLNADILAFVIDNDLDASEAIRQLRELDSNAIEFLQYFLETSSSREKLVVLLAAHWEGVLTYLVDVLETDDENRLSLFSAATNSLVDSLTYETNETLRAYLTDHADLLPFLANDEAARPTETAELLRSANVKLAAIDKVGASIRPTIVSCNAFAFTESNLVAIVGQRDLSLDAIARHSDGLYDYAIESVGSYLEIQRHSSATPIAIRERPTFIRTLTSLAGSDVLHELLRRSASTISIPRLSALPASTWRQVVEGRFVEPSARNVLDYFNALGWDEAITALIRRRRSLDDVEDLSTAERKQLAIELFSAIQLTTTLRARIAKRLLEGDQVEPSEVPTTAANLLGPLLERGVLPDTADTFAASKGSPWSSREAVVAASREFPNYVTPGLLTWTEIAQIAGSERIRSSNKTFIYADLATYTKGLRGGLTDVARNAQKSRIFISSADLAMLATRGLHASWVIILAWNGLPRRTIADLESILVAIGGKYAQLTAYSNNRPKFENKQWNEMLLEHLVKYGKVKKFGPAAWSADWLVANMKP